MSYSVSIYNGCSRNLCRKATFQIDMDRLRDIMVPSLNLRKFHASEINENILKDMEGKS